MRTDGKISVESDKDVCLPQTFSLSTVKLLCET